MSVIGRIGRRPMYLTGIGLMGFFMLLIGIVGSIPSDNTAIGIGVMLVIIRITFKMTLGPCCCKSTTSDTLGIDSLYLQIRSSPRHLPLESEVRVWSLDGRAMLLVVSS